MVVADQLACFLRQLAREWASDQETGRRRSEKAIRLQVISGDLQAHKLIVRHVLVERLDDKIAIVVSTRAIPIELVTAALGKPHGVEPVPSPAFAVMRAGEQTIQKSVVGAG